MASSWSHRHTVLSLMVATMPQRCASRTMSAVLKRESGRPRVAGNSHARALIWTTRLDVHPADPVQIWGGHRWRCLAIAIDPVTI